MITITNARKEEQHRAMSLITLKTPEQERDAKVPEENVETKGMTTTINTREEEQPKVKNLIALKTPKGRSPQIYTVRQCVTGKKELFC